MGDKISLSEGAGGKEMQELIERFGLDFRGGWEGSDDDSATISVSGKKIAFTTDSYVVSPIFFKGGDIGHIAFCGTVNDLCMSCASPIGISLSIVIEEGFDKKDLMKIIASIKKLSKETGIPIATGDTKVMEKGSVDKIIINTSGIGIVDECNDNNDIMPGYQVIISGGIGEHAVALLSERFDFDTDIITDSKPLVKEMKSVKKMIKYAKDPTRGGIASALNDISQRFGVMIEIEEENIPIKKGVRKACEMLGIDPYTLACEGRFICICSKENSDAVKDELRKYNDMAEIIGEIKEGKGVILKTVLGKTKMNVPSGRIVPRIC